MCVMSLCRGSSGVKNGPKIGFSTFLGEPSRMVGEGVGGPEKAKGVHYKDLF